LTQPLELKVNGREYRLEVGLTDSLLQVLRDRLGLMSPKSGCNTGDCGACTVILGGRLVKSCVTHALIAQGQEVLTVEGLGRPGRLHPLQKAFAEHNAAQCGFCTPGMILAAKALLDQNQNPSPEEVREGLSGNLCRCTGYAKIVEAVLAAAEEMRQS